MKAERISPILTPTRYFTAEGIYLVLELFCAKMGFHLPCD